MTFKTRALRQVGLVAGAACFVSAFWPATGPAMAEDGMWNSVLGFFGMGHNDKVQDDAIDYSARPALVVPPKMDLPPPQAAVAHPTDWPKDPDAMARHKAEADSRRPAPPSDTNANASQADEPQEKPAPEAHAAATASHVDKRVAFPGFGGQSLAASPGVSLGPGGQGQGQGSCSQFFGTSICAPWQWFNFSQNENLKALKVGVEPPREYLVQPPSGYQLPVVADEPQDANDASNGAASSVSDQNHDTFKPKPASSENGLGQLIH